MPDIPPVPPPADERLREYWMCFFEAQALRVALCRRAQLPEPETEHRFAPPRRWRFDYAWPTHRVALEVEGGAWTGGRHTRGAGFLKDMEKYNEAARLGWRVLRCTPATLDTLSTVQLIADVIALHAAP